MSGVELGARYKAGKDGACVSFRHGDVLQLAPFSFVMFRWTPLKVEGRLLRVGRRGTLQHEAPALEPAEVKSGLNRAGVEPTQPRSMPKHVVMNHRRSDLPISQPASTAQGQDT